jgi:pilus assembly protein Flp/PilA
MRALFHRGFARLQGDQGATAVEYALLVALIAVAIIAAVTALGGGLNNLFTNVKSSLGM